MKHLITSMLLVATAIPALGAAVDPMCTPLRSFVGSVKPGETRELTFHTQWGSNFIGEAEPAISAKVCTHSDDLPAKAVCTYLIENGAAEFADNNVKRALSCLSTRTQFDPSLELEQGIFSLSYGNSSRGSFVTIKFAKDNQLGGMAFSISAKGY